jgi:hypothetical protein
MFMSTKKLAMSFNVTQTHNRYDCETAHSSGRYGMNRRVDLRIGYIITVFCQTPTGFKSVQSVVDRLNRTYKGAGYNNNDVRHALHRMRDELRIVTYTSSDGWVIKPNARAIYSKVSKRGV